MRRAATRIWIEKIYPPLSQTLTADPVTAMLELGFPAFVPHPKGVYSMIKASGDLGTVLKRLTSALLGLSPVAVYLFGLSIPGGFFMSPET